MLDIVRQREISGFSASTVKRFMSSSCLQRMELQGTLQGHSGCVNTCSFDTQGGNTLITGSDDLDIIIWDWDTGRQRLKFSSSHRNNVFQARMVPHTGGTRLVTCAADGQVRLCELPEGADSVSVSSCLLGQHSGRAHKLSLDPLSPANCFYSCGEDGQVIHYDLRCVPAGVGSSSSSSSSGARRKLLVCHGYSRARGATNRVVSINAIHTNPIRPWQFAIGGSDVWARVYDCRRTRDSSSGSAGSSSGSSGAFVGPPTRQQAAEARVYSMYDEPLAYLCPQGLAAAQQSGGLGMGDPHITCVKFSQQGELLVSYNDEDIYLFRAAAANGGSSSSSSQEAAEAGAAELPAGGHQQQQQQQQHRADSSNCSPARRSRAAVAAEDAAAAVAADEPAGQPTAMDTGAATGTGSMAAAAAAVAAAGEDDDEEERPRWKRRQQGQQQQQQHQLPTAAGNVAQGQGLGGPEGQQQLAAAAAAGGGGIGIGADDPPAAATAADVFAAGNSSGSSSSRQLGLEQPQHLAGPGSSSSSINGRRWLGRYDWRQQQSQLLPHSGLSAAQFYGSSSRDGVIARYYGHRNAATVKGVSFFGQEDEWVMSGSDDGYIYIWSKASGRIVWWQLGDEEVVNCLEPHPSLPLVLATSGIDSDVKVWAPTAAAPQPLKAAALSAQMRANAAERHTAQQAATLPEDWLLHLLAAQRRRVRAAERARRRQRQQVAAAAAAGTAAGGGTEAAAGPGAGAGEAAEEEQEEQEEEGRGGLEQLLLPPAGVRIVWAPAGTRRRQRDVRQGAAAAQGGEGTAEDEGAEGERGSSGEDAITDDDVDDDDGDRVVNEDEDGSEDGAGYERPCHIS